MRRQVCKRHNRAARLIHGAVAKGSAGASLAFMDAKADGLDGVMGFRVPTWVAPVPDGVARRWRPDLLYVTPPRHRGGLPGDRDSRALASLVAAAASGTAPPPALLLRAKTAFTVHVVEVGFVSESSSSWTARLQAKAKQQDPLCAALREAGWARVQSHIVPVGSAGTVFSRAGVTLSALGVRTQDSRVLLRSLHFLATRAAADLLRTRCELLSKRSLSRAGRSVADPG